MEKKNIFLELPCELIEKIDRLNTTGDRSIFINDLLEKQLQKQEIPTDLEPTTELTTKMSESGETLGVGGELKLVNSKGVSLGIFDINTVEGFEDLAMKIQELSEDPIVRIKARRLL